ncbi:MAG TPA: hypothetical protein V6C58_01260 [Allocoleopsis sp.]
MANFNNQLIKDSPIQPFNYNMGTYFKTADDFKRESDQFQMGQAYDRNKGNQDAYFGELEKMGFRKPSVQKGFKNEYYDDAIKNPNKYVWGIWDKSKEATPDNWQPKPKQQQKQINQQPVQNKSTIESSANRFGQIAESNPVTLQPINNTENKLLVTDNPIDVATAVNNAVQNSVLLNSQNNNSLMNNANNNQQQVKNYFDPDYFKSPY